MSTGMTRTETAAWAAYALPGGNRRGETMAYDIASGDGQPAARWTAEDYDRQNIELARQLAALNTADDVRAFYAQRYPEGHPNHELIQRTPLAAYFGRTTLVLHDLLAIIDRQAAEIIRLEDSVNRQHEEIAALRDDLDSVLHA